MSGSAYGAGAPSYESVELQRSAIKGRLKVAVGIRDQAADAGDEKRRARWSEVVDELLERLTEVQGRSGPPA
ncbi:MULTISPECIES: hypothetical protein [unclassified Nocardioides]|uniref:hypothetical protein n=1 Tax=unclassified Nocardioides TaxID=2615069 RepID=UPI0009EF9A98|nr:MULTISPECIES: hypothetical protein [unclassified Nocardioides]GAW50600.1 Putative transcriptional regulator [Nocardioides sp. PD653-B2]GAW57578.1 putative transcriptional regulator [Nocardioides sp. PD653]